MFGAALTGLSTLALGMIGALGPALLVPALRAAVRNCHPRHVQAISFATLPWAGAAGPPIGLALVLVLLAAAWYAGRTAGALGTVPLNAGRCDTGAHEKAPKNVIMRTDVKLNRLDERLLAELLQAAVTDADPVEVMPPLEGPSGWTPERRTAFVQFHQSRSLSADPVEVTYAITVAGRVAGAARLCPLGESGRTAEAGVWIGRSHRGTGVGTAVLELLLNRARAAGFTSVYVSTTPDNAAVRSLLSARGVDLVPDGDALTAHMELTTGP